MAEAKIHLPSLRFAAIFSQDVSAIDQICRKATEAWGEILLQSQDFDFDMTSYYKATMGESLKKRLVAFRTPVDPAILVESKHLSNRWEKEFVENGEFPENWNHQVERPVNIDPGYLTEAKVVLMTTKDRDHRLYLGDGIYGEVTLFYQLPGTWVTSRWTYPDYKLAEYHEFFSACRDYLRERLQQTTAANYNED